MRTITLLSFALMAINYCGAADAPPVASPDSGPALRINVTEEQTHFRERPNNPKLPSGFHASMYVDIGTIHRGNTLSISVPYRNTGNVSKRLEKRSASCGCIEVGKLPQSVAPGEVSSLNIELNPKGKHGKLTEYVMLSDKETKKYVLTITLSAVVAGIWTEPEVLNFGTIRQGDSVARQVRAFAAGHKDGNLNVLEANPSVISTSPVAAASAKSDQARGVEVLRVAMITIDAKVLNPGPFQGKVVLKSDTDPAMEITIPVVAHVIGRATVLPPIFDFGYVRGGKTTSREVILSIVDPQVHNAKLTFEPDCDFINVQAEKVPTSQHDVESWTITASLSDTAKPPKRLVCGQIKVLNGTQIISSIPYLLFIPEHE